jgi:hypothetical protein
MFSFRDLANWIEAHAEEYSPFEHKQEIRLEAMMPNKQQWLMSKARRVAKRTVKKGR